MYFVYLLLAQVDSSHTNTETNDCNNTTAIMVTNIP